MIELVIYISAAVVVYLALLFHPLARSRPLSALALSLAWPMGGVFFAVYHVYLMLEAHDDDLPPRPTPPWGER